jgi:oligoendopeptidase F
MAKKTSGKAVKTRKAKTVPSRAAVKREDSWNLAILYKSDGAWDRAYQKLEGMIEGFGAFQGELGKSAKTLRACLDFEVAFEKLAEPLGSYAFLKMSEDVANPTYLGMVQRYTFLATRAGEVASFIAPEIQAIPKKKLESFMKSAVLKDYRFNLEKLVRYRPHILSKKEERVLAMQGEIAGTAGRVFDQLNDADMTFGSVKNHEGQIVELTQSSFIGLLESPKRAVRKKAFHQFYEEYEAHKNTLAASLSSSVLEDVYHARVRNHPSALEGALFSDRVPLAVYDKLIDTVHSNLDSMHRYLEVRRKALKLKDVHIYDCYVPIVEGVKTNLPYDKAVTQICEALEPLGSAYVKTLEKGLTKGRWVDRYENEGKRSGAFSAGGYKGPPYILMNYKPNTLNGIFTLAHEAGHSMHTHYSAANQPFQNYNYTIFVAEVASTFNEQLLGKYLRERAKSKKMQAYLITKELEEIRGTLIRQTMFAEYEKIIHAIAEAGEPLTAERLQGEYASLLELYFGPDFAMDEPLSLEGLRIPHFYRAFYVYKYATGISASIALADRVLNGGKKELNAYMGFLKAGGSKFPLDILRGAGVDLEQPVAVEAAMARFNGLVDELEGLVG